MAAEAKPIQSILDDLSRQLSQQAVDVDNKFEELSQSQMRSFAQRSAEVEADLVTKAHHLELSIQRHANERLQSCIRDIEKKSEESSKKLKVVLATTAALLFAGTFVFFSEMREKAADKSLEFQKDIIAAETSVDASMANLRTDLKDSQDKIEVARAALDTTQKELSKRQIELETVASDLEREKKEYESLSTRLKSKTP